MRQDHIFLIFKKVLNRLAHGGYIPYGGLLRIKSVTIVPGSQKALNKCQLLTAMTTTITTTVTNIIISISISKESSHIQVTSLRRREMI